MSVPSAPDGSAPEVSVDFTQLKALSQEYGIELVGPLPDA
jgi:hypothetical protein